ncbi:LysM peptidoglycan-binding domain-containing protein [Bacillaceae bacterium Marseille-Q3522]|nr:LysM peptidoglycan-binding domain-containing protein [Bacillaceae bacterium Marseille-Q3522]
MQTEYITQTRRARIRLARKKLILKRWKKFAGVTLAAAVMASTVFSTGIKQTSTTLANPYIVQKGDTLYKLSKQFGTTIKNLQETNALTSSTIFTGQQLTIPHRKYIVKKFPSNLMN